MTRRVQGSRGPISASRSPPVAGGRVVVVLLDQERCYRAVASRDARFDGQFITAVRTTGIYCRPSCPATTPKRANVEFLPTAGAAQQRGYRACRRCLPDAVPGSPEWNVRADLAARAMRLIADGVVEREGVPGLATRLGYSERQLNRVLTAELGAGPLALARAHRAHTARLLIETTPLAMADIAFAAGFASVRQFNDTVREVYGVAPTTLRAEAGRRRGAVTAVAGTLVLRLPYRPPFDAARPARVLRRPRRRRGWRRWSTAVVPAHAAAAARRRRRSRCLPPRDGHVVATLRLADPRDLGPAVARLRRLLDLDADPVAVDEAARRPTRRWRRPSRRCRASGCPARSTAPRRRCAPCSASRSRWPRPARRRRGWPRRWASGSRPRSRRRRRRTCCSRRPRRSPSAAPRCSPGRPGASRPCSGWPRRSPTARSCSTPGATPPSCAPTLVALPGIGPWTAGYLAMRAARRPRRAAGHRPRRPPRRRRARPAVRRRRTSTARAAGWAPWRSYAATHLWRRRYLEGGPHDQHLRHHPTAIGPFTAVVDEDGAVLASGWTADLDDAAARSSTRRCGPPSSSRATSAPSADAIVRYHDGDLLGDRRRAGAPAVRRVPRARVGRPAHGARPARPVTYTEYAAKSGPPGGGPRGGVGVRAQRGRAVRAVPPRAAHRRHARRLPLGPGRQAALLAHESAR